ncbi:hypothetical protein HZB02_03735 [Candidatus Woesearchaeota archaeon]|nr:hypothetical protein [Candidatus Woesearchaeota archaeon]
MKHDRYVHELKQQLIPFYDSIDLNVPVYRKKRVVGEIDLIARKGKWTDLYEVKCSWRLTKAKKQLARIRKHLHILDGNVFFYCGLSKQLLMV